MPVSLQIPEPCSERWSTMTPVDESCRHCAVCEKNIVDFTSATDAEILAHFKKHRQLCGRFKSDQLNRPLQAAARYGSRRMSLSALAAGFAAVLSAQKPVDSPIRTEPVLERPSNDHSASMPPERVAPSTPGDSLRTVSGRVFDGETGEPLVGAIIILKGTVRGACTGVDGVFNLKFPPALAKPETALALEVRYTGFHSEEIVLPDRVRQEDLAILPITLNVDQEIYLTGIVICSLPREKFGHKVRRFFRFGR